MEDSSNCDIARDGETVAATLNQMITELKCDLQPLNIDSISCSDCDASSVVSVKEGCVSPLSSWDSEPKGDTSSITRCHELPEESLLDVDLEGNFGDLEEENQFVRVENIDDSFLWEMDNRSYEELLKKFIEKEEELRVSEQEIVGLRVQVENSESQINDMHEKLELKKDELYEQKELSYREIFKLVNQIKKSESQLENVRGELNLKNGQLDNVRGELSMKNCELDNVRKELELKAEELNKQMEFSNEEIFKLKTQIKDLRNEADSKPPMTHELQCQIKEEKENMAILKCELESLVRTNEDNDINHMKEVRKLISTMFDLHVKSFWKKQELRSNIANLLKQKEQLTSKLEYYESRNIEQAFMKLKN